MYLCNVTYTCKLQIKTDKKKYVQKWLNIGQY